MKQERSVQYRCDECRKNITDRKHIRMFVGFSSGWMVAPYKGGMPVRSVSEREPESHFCCPEHFTLFFERKLHAINPHTSRSARKLDGPSLLELVLEEDALERSRMRGPVDVGARNVARGEESERGMGNNQDMRESPFSGSVPGLRNTEQGNQPLDSDESYQELGWRREEVPAHLVEKRVSVSQWFIRPVNSIRRAVLDIW